ncbi:MAG: LuxR C-terminal-related transcriptional regulator [Draconibacterium sp.]|nr:LuxR C-terminal-related transcriptional regulator [Draconibacterium sp.]
MTEQTGLWISVINLLSLGLGGIAITLMVRLRRKFLISSLNSFLTFLILAVIAGFCDWVIFNWVFILVPDLSPDTTDIIYHILWDLIGFPAMLFAILYLVRFINPIIGVKLNPRITKVVAGILFLLIILSYISLYFRLNETQNFLRVLVVFISNIIIPGVIFIYLLLASAKTYLEETLEKSKRIFIYILFVGFLFWILFSLVPIQLGVWRHLIILSYYLALFVPSLFLYFKNQAFRDQENFVGNDLRKVLGSMNLTERERELAKLLLAGKSNQQIADEIFVSLQTVKNYVSKIYKKAGVKNRVQFVNRISVHMK